MSLPLSFIDQSSNWDFIPPRWLRNGHAQTIAAAYLYPDPTPETATRHELTLADGDRLILHDDCPATWQAGDPMALLLHGVSGCHRSPYMIRLARKLKERGTRAFRLDFRGCGAGELLAERPGHAGRSEDAAAAIAMIKSLATDSPVSIIGFSMGGNVALKFLGELGEQGERLIHRAVAVAPPIDLPVCSRNLERGWNRVYSRNFVQRLMRQVRARQPSSPAIAKLELHPVPQSLIEFDDRVTAALSGFRDVHDYYLQSSAVRCLSRIAAPTLIIAAQDDPLIPAEIFNRQDYSTSTQLMLTRHGGHVGYLGRTGIDADRWWLDWRILDWLGVQSSGDAT